MSAQTTDAARLRTVGMHRLRSGEYPESIARDLVKQGLSSTDVENLFRDAAGKVRGSGVVRVVAGVALLVLTALLVWAMSEAGVRIYGPGLAIGLIVLVNGFLKIKNSGEIAKAAQAAAR
jgi:hypothetical protein